MAEHEPATPSTTIVVPTYVEAENIDGFLRAVRGAVPDARIIVVDDSSPDGTADIARQCGEELTNVHVFVRPVKDGLGNAYRFGFAKAIAEGAERIVQLDADFSHNPNDIPRLLARLDDGAGVAIGSRYVPGGSTPHWPFHRRWLSKAGNRYATWILSLQLRDATAGFRAYETTVLQKIHFEETTANGYAFQLEVAFRLAKWGGRIDEVPIAFADRVRGQSKMSLRIMVESMLLVTYLGVTSRFRAVSARRRPR